MEAIKWLSDNSWLWVTGARGVTPRLSLLDRSDYNTTDTNGFLPKYRLAYIDGMKYCRRRLHSGARYGGLRVLRSQARHSSRPKCHESYAHQLSVPNFVSTICAKWQSDINSGGVLLTGS